MTEETQQRELEAAGHITLTIRREQWYAAVQFTLYSVQSPDGSSHVN